MSSTPKNLVVGDAGPSFNWHAEPEGFLKWLIPTVISGLKDGGFKRISEATTDFTDVRINMQINGVPVDALAFIAGVHRNMDYAVGVEAQRIVREETKFSEVEDLVHDAMKAVRRSLLKQLEKAGIELRDEDSW